MVPPYLAAAARLSWAYRLNIRPSSRFDISSFDLLEISKTFAQDLCLSFTSMKGKQQRTGGQMTSPRKNDVSKAVLPVLVNHEFEAFFCDFPKRRADRLECLVRVVTQF